MIVLVCVGMVAPAGALSAVTAVCISIASLMTIAAVEEVFGHGRAFLEHGGCLDLNAHNLIAAECLTHNVALLMLLIPHLTKHFIDVLCTIMPCS